MHEKPFDLGFERFFFNHMNSQKNSMDFNRFNQQIKT